MPHTKKRRIPITLRVFACLLLITITAFWVLFDPPLVDDSHLLPAPYPKVDPANNPVPKLLEVFAKDSTATLYERRQALLEAATVPHRLWSHDSTDPRIGHEPLYKEVLRCFDQELGKPESLNPAERLELARSLLALARGFAFSDSENGVAVSIAMDFRHHVLTLLESLAESGNTALFRNSDIREGLAEVDRLIRTSVEQLIRRSFLPVHRLKETKIEPFPTISVRPPLLKPKATFNSIASYTEKYLKAYPDLSLTSKLSSKLAAPPSLRSWIAGNPLGEKKARQVASEMIIFWAADFRRADSRLRALNLIDFPQANSE